MKSLFKNPLTMFCGLILLLHVPLVVAYCLTTVSVDHTTYQGKPHKVWVNINQSISVNETDADGFVRFPLGEFTLFLRDGKLFRANSPAYTRYGNFYLGDKPATKEELALFHRYL